MCTWHELVCTAVLRDIANIHKVFVDLLAGGGGSKAAAVTLDTVADESRKMADCVARSPSRLCSRDGKICCYGERLEYHFLACVCALLPTFRFFLISSCIPVCSSSCPFVCATAICSQSMYFIVRVLSACVNCTLPHLGILLFFIRLLIVFFFRSSYFSGGVFLLSSRTWYAST